MPAKAPAARPLSGQLKMARGNQENERKEVTGALWSPAADADGLRELVELRRRLLDRSKASATNIGRPPSRSARLDEEAAGGGAVSRTGRFLDTDALSVVAGGSKDKTL